MGAPRGTGETIHHRAHRAHRERVARAPSASRDCASPRPCSARRMTVLPETAAELEREVARRRTFAIISHPDAGKTTLTEKLLLYGGAIEEAGSVRARKQQRHTTSDWMAIEQSRGISISSTVL